MNYYEELGIGPDAGEEDIRKAHRRLVKLMHPDAQRDQSLKMLAETQMRRLNSIVSTLLDPDQRRSYDDQLRGVYAVKPIPQRTVWRGMPWWIASAAGAVVLTLAAVWFWADHMGSSFGKTTRTVYVSPETTKPSGSSSDPAPLHDAADAQSASAAPNPTNSAAPTEPKPSPADAAQPFPPSPVPSSPAPSGRIRATVIPSETRPDTWHPTKPESSRPNVSSPRSVTVARVPSGHSSVAAVSKPSPPPKVSSAIKSPARESEAGSNTADSKKTSDPPAVSLIANAGPKPNPDNGQLPASPATSPSPPPHGDAPVSVPATATPPSASGSPKSEIAPKPEVATVTSVPTKTGAAIAARDPLEGEWVYAPKEPEKRKSGFYPPEFIDLKLFANDSGNLHGQYNARYQVSDKPISPNVAFQLAAVDKNSHKFVWQSSDGAKGTLAIHPVDDRTIRLEWRTTSSVRGPALTSGAATLVRRQ